MSTLPRKPSVGSRAMGAALVTLGVSLGVSVPLHAAKEKPAASTPAVPGAPSVEQPLSAEQIKLHGGQYKLNAKQMKLLETDNMQLAADQKALADFKASLTADQIKLEANQVKLRSMQAKVEADRQKLAGHFIKINTLEPDPWEKTK